MSSQETKREPADNSSAATSPEDFTKRAVELGALGAEVVSPADIVTNNWVRWKCRFGCGGYATSRMCPPHAPSPDETRKLLDEYSVGILFEAPHGEATRIAVELEREVFLAGYYKGLGAGPCRLCESCSVDEPCRHPYEARPAMEAAGIDVYATVRKHGFTIDVVRDHDDPQHYYAVVLVE